MGAGEDEPTVVPALPAPSGSLAVERSVLSFLRNSGSFSSIFRMSDMFLPAKSILDFGFWFWNFGLFLGRFSQKISFL